MKNSQIKIVLLLLIALGASCSIEEVKPINQLNEENVIRNAESAQLVLNGIYDSWREFEVSFFPLHLAALGVEGQIVGPIFGGNGFNTNQVPVEYSYLPRIYSTFYKIINESNFLIHQLEAGAAEGISEEEKSRIISEAKFNRAFAYFKLLKYFGQFYDLSSPYGVVVRTEFATGLEAKPRNSVQEVYDLIVADLEYAVQNGPTAVPHYYGGSLASKALLAKVKLYMGDYATAAELAKEVINNNQGYSLESQYSDIFFNTYNSPEALFVLYHSVDEGGSYMIQINQTDFSANLEILANAQAEGEGDLTGTGQGYDPRFSYAYSEATEGPNQMGKYPFRRSGGISNTNFHLRLAEIYLIYAEAEVRKNGGDLNAALDALNTIRLRARVKPKELSTKEQLLEDIRKEKLLELFFENGESWFDLVRYHILGDVNAFDVKPTLTSTDQFVLPIPLEVLTANNKLKQNPGY